MMFHRTDGDDVFHDWLDDEFSWRRIELSHYERVVRTAKLGTEAMIVRGAIPILYAHWEGFVKTSGTAYLEFVLSRNKKFDNLKPNFLALGMKKHLHEAASTLKGKIFAEACDLILAKRSTRAYFMTQDAVDTGSNLGYELFVNI